MRLNSRSRYIDLLWGILTTGSQGHVIHQVNPQGYYILTSESRGLLYIDQWIHRVIIYWPVNPQWYHSIITSIHCAKLLVSKRCETLYQDVFFSEMWNNFIKWFAKIFSRNWNSYLSRTSREAVMKLCKKNPSPIIHPLSSVVLIFFDIYNETCTMTLQQSTNIDVWIHLQMLPQLWTCDISRPRLTNIYECDTKHDTRVWEENHFSP